jgi:hypothetical protein
MFAGPPSGFGEDGEGGSLNGDGGVVGTALALFFLDFAFSTGFKGSGSLSMGVSWGWVGGLGDIAVVVGGGDAVCNSGDECDV